MKSYLALLGRFPLAAVLVAFGCQTSLAQVVDINPNTPSGFDGYANFSTDGNASFSSPAPSSYNAFRKANSANNPGAPTVSDDGNGTTATWTNLSHGGTFGGACCGNPGVFFGQSPSTSTYSDAQMVLGAYTEPGNSNTRAVGNVNATGGTADAPDSTGRRQYEFRIGFTESPTDWQTGKSEGSAAGDYDLWIGDHGSDTIYSAINIGSTDFDFAANPTVEPIVKSVANGGNLANSSNHYIRLNSALRAQNGTAPNFVSNNDERSRDRWISEGNTSFLQELNEVAPDAPTWEDTAQSLSGTITESRSFNLTQAADNDSTFDTGVAYDDLVDLSWHMELNDPGAAAGTKEAREVKFTIQSGNVRISQVFDPGEPGSPSVPNPIVNASEDLNGNTFDDGYFDWQNAYPIFYLGPGGGPTAPQSANSFMPIGFVNAAGDPNDADGDGDVDGADFLELQRSNPAGITDWQSAYGSPLSGVAGVPEPSTALLAVMLFGIGGATQRRR